MAKVYLKANTPAACVFFFSVLIPVPGKLFFLLCIKPCLTGSKDSLCSQGNQGELHITAAQTGVEQRVPQAAKG